ncbi:hypothetical protein MIND_00395300 [Mycena indigotica]|uniref:Uncharacterized protein n=1 Tax=Mycena indigotica TaxID=2126181 RepID=A0A8H6WBG6_9AGAR|nr:uncharacterized protein MIND_00395300 [Mycena indigotica]KAF7310216.1 hypothetical protein MIND_00395300 [Mycena indigotica]
MEPDGASDGDDTPSHSRARTPDSPLTTRESLYAAASTIDDLTHALADLSRAASPEPPGAPACCCGRDGCANLRAWGEVKGRLEARLTLSAEVGQALLARHEAYVRRHERGEAAREDGDSEAAVLQDQLDEAAAANKALEKRLTQALVNNEVTEVSNKTILAELAEAKTTISRMTTSAARSVGWDTRLSAAMKEKDDMQQERDAEGQRARLAEGRFAALKERTSKLQSEVRRLQSALEERREHRLESSESILLDARKRIDALSRTVGAPVEEQESELTPMLATLVDDNETLKRDNAELQTLLADAREDYRALQEEVEDQRINPAPARSGPATPSHLRQHFHTGSVPSVMLSPSYSLRRSSSTERRSSRRYEPLTPETTRRPLSPTDSLANSETRWSSFSGARAPIPPEADDVAEERRHQKPLFLLARSRGVQTDAPPPTPVQYPASHSPSSNASVYSEPLTAGANLNAQSTQSLSIGAIVERTTALLQRIQAADALSLTNRLKRQQIRGADLRGAGGEAEIKAQRREVRALLTVLREMFGALGEMRVVLNEVVLDPTSAGRISEAAMNPGRAAAKEGEEQGGGRGWIAPLSKLFAGTPTAPPSKGDERERAPVAAPRPMPARLVPKLGPALAASATTVNVEFSGAAAGGRATTSTFDAGPPLPTRSNTASTDVMGIFAGAPRNRTPDPWVVVGHPRAPRANPLLNRPGPNRMSRNVDAVLDGVGVRGGTEDADEEPDYVGPLLARTLRRRGLSDSSIHSTFAAHAAEDGPQDTGTVFQALTRRLQSFRSGLSSGVVVGAEREGPSPQPVASGSRSTKSGTSGAPSLSGSGPGTATATSPPGRTAPIGIARRASQRAHPKTSASVGGLGFLASLVPAGEQSDLARSLRDGEIHSRRHRALGPEQDFL